MTQMHKDRKKNEEEEEEKNDNACVCKVSKVKCETAM
jgi:hypothetical protein